MMDQRDRLQQAFAFVGGQVGEDAAVGDDRLQQGQCGLEAFGGVGGRGAAQGVIRDSMESTIIPWFAPGPRAAYLVQRGFSHRA